MNKINLRECINRKVEYSIVFYSVNEKRCKDIIYGHTTTVKEMKRIIKIHENVPSNLNIIHMTEQRHMTLEDFINHSLLS